MLFDQFLLKSVKFPYLRIYTADVFLLSLTGMDVNCCSKHEIQHLGFMRKLEQQRMDDNPF